MSKVTLMAATRLAGKVQGVGAVVDVAEPRAGRLVERGRAVYAEAAPVNRAEGIAGRPVLGLPADTAPDE